MNRFLRYRISCVSSRMRRCQVTLHGMIRSEDDDFVQHINNRYISCPSWYPLSKRTSRVYSTGP